MSFSSSFASLIKIFIKWLLVPLLLFACVSAGLYYVTEAKKNRRWTIEHSVLAKIVFNEQKDAENPAIHIENIRDFQWRSDDVAHYRDISFHLKDIKGLKAVVSHFAPISDIAHVFIIFVLNDNREFGVSIEARREQGEHFSLSGGLLAKFELIYVIATPEDLLGVRMKNNEEIHAYPIKATQEKAQELFKLISNDANKLIENPALYHLFFKNCTNQLVKNVSILTEEKYPWYFQTIAPGRTGKLLFDLDLIDLPEKDFKTIQAKTLLRHHSDSGK